MIRRKLKHFPGKGFENCPFIGKFQVVADEVHFFNCRDEAAEFYKNLKTSKSFWDVTTSPQLMDCYAY